jgi:hypothetical protein
MIEPTSEPLVSAVIPAYLRPGPLGRCLDSLLAQTYRNLEIIVVDDAADDATRDVVDARARPGLKYLRHEIRSLTAQSMNDGIRASRGDILVVMGDDNILHSDAIAGFVRAFGRDPRIAFVGALVHYLDPPDRIHTAGARVTRFTRRLITLGENEIDRGQFRAPYDVEIVDGCIGMRRSVFATTGMVDARRLPFYHETTSIQFRARQAGLRIVLDPSIRVWHDLPPTARQTRALVSPLRAYYMMRSRILLERYYDEPSKTATFAIALPFYALSFLGQAVTVSASETARWAVLRALMAGLRDGLLDREGIRIL